MKNHSHDHFDDDRRDRELITAVRRKLEHSGHKNLRRVKAKVERGTIVLTGRVPSKDDRELAEEIVGKVAHVETVLNSIEVGEESHG